METIGIIGAGNVGNALARGLKRAGNEVKVAGHERGAIRELVTWAEIVVASQRRSGPSPIESPVLAFRAICSIPQNRCVSGHRQRTRAMWTCSRSMGTMPSCSKPDR